MSEIAENPVGISGSARSRPRPEPAAHEEYAFACMHCGHGWEQAYDIEHQVDAKGATRVVYYADGERVPSPLTRPSCLNCGGTVVRIMRAGRVSAVSRAMESLHQRHPSSGAEKPGSPPDEAAAEETPGSSAAERAERHHWHLAALLHPFQRRHGKEGG